MGQERAGAEAEAAHVAVPTSLDYVPEAKRATSSAVIGPTAMVPLMVAVGVAIAGFPYLSIPVGIAVSVGMIVARRKAATIPVATLRVEKGTLSVALGAAAPREMALHRLLDVALDTKTVERVQEATSGFPELRFIDATVMPPVDEARIELVLKDESIFLSDDYTSHLDATEWFGKIRRFLRKNGWVPEDERGGSLPPPPP